ncbi:hypothetical protein B1207_12400 [Legionella quinlivanii]|uniref:Uncharacterized protein n=1 Tax=Legionella quinlivanii TaxID=45073 RepID=A0A364LH37_9GAMM|nr:hypothetical protein [Legionella quinlivanii]RAP35492.1 hypothetical protein B1207_12400 [Legionella quinlivanii]
MPVSDLCRKSFEEMILNYQKIGLEDRDFENLHRHLKQWLYRISVDDSEYNDARFVMEIAHNVHLLNDRNSGLIAAYHQFTKDYFRNTSQAQLFVKGNGDVVSNWPITPEPLSRSPAVPSSAATTTLFTKLIQETAEQFAERRKDRALNEINKKFTILPTENSPEVTLK